MIRSTNSSEGGVNAILADDGMSCELFLPRGDVAERIQRYWVQYHIEEVGMDVDDKNPERLRMDGCTDN